ncbi:MULTISPECIES: RICIN domain-containing protein [unclassified Streptomyces]|uniref:RICIN domain-containing protein n=1 Tax=unclassified Streptomyces TaxID=2593676 RepID=UPI0028C478FA|nr:MULTISPECIES: RICIN domain-containing protein [unclassified Streptomyces]WNO75310.1 RICIN domain-containing protein [Streptomyces sp. AM8-1-1]
MTARFTSKKAVRRTTAVAAATLALIGGSLVTGQPASAVTFSGRLMNAATRLCMDGSGAAGPGAAVIQWECNGGANQRWYTSTDSRGRQTIVNSANGLCLDRHDDTRPGAKLILWHCNSKWNQVFSGGTGANPIVNDPSGHVIDVPGGTGVWGTQLIMWERNGGSNQGWWLV